MFLPAVALVGSARPSYGHKGNRFPQRYYRTGRETFSSATTTQGKQNDPTRQVLKLIERFERNLDHYKQPDYKEARVRAEFIDSFLEALGWDVHKRQGRGEYAKDVIHLVCLNHAFVLS